MSLPVDSVGVLGVGVRLGYVSMLEIGDGPLTDPHAKYQLLLRIDIENHLHNLQHQGSKLDSNVTLWVTGS